MGLPGFLQLGVIANGYLPFKFPGVKVDGIKGAKRRFDCRVAIRAPEVAVRCKVQVSGGSICYAVRSTGFLCRPVLFYFFQFRFSTESFVVALSNR
jgi:hypothetical protein